jgi:hypothetical protein
VIVLLEQRKVLLLASTATGVRLVAIWKQKVERWYIIVEPESETENLKNVIDKLTPRQFQDALEKGKFHFAW